jgi:hypothetical protein
MNGALRRHPGSHGPSRIGTDKALVINPKTKVDYAEDTQTQDSRKRRHGAHPVGQVSFATTARLWQLAQGWPYNGGRMAAVERLESPAKVPGKQASKPMKTVRRTGKTGRPRTVQDCGGLRWHGIRGNAVGK